jgi:hypothetical protein
MFPYPLQPCPAIAVLSRHFPGDTDLEGAGTVAAPINAILEIDPQKWSPDYPVIVLSHVDDGLITDADREYIWRTFGVPAFEYVLNGDGRIVARECEAHHGLHLEGLVDGEVTADPCPCGRLGDRLLRLAEPV